MKLLVLFTKPISTTTNYDQDPNLIFTVIKYAQLNNIFFIYWNDKYIYTYIYHFILISLYKISDYPVANNKQYLFYHDTCKYDIIFNLQVTDDSLE